MNDQIIDKLRSLLLHYAWEKGFGFWRMDDAY